MQGHLPGCSEEAGLLQSLFLMENIFYTPRTCPSLSFGTRISSPVQELKDGSSSSLACSALSGTAGRESGTCAHNPNPTFQTLSVWRSVRKSPELIRFRNSPSPHPPAQIGAHLKGKSPEDATLVKCNTLKGQLYFPALSQGQNANSQVQPWSWFPWFPGPGHGLAGGWERELFVQTEGLSLDQQQPVQGTISPF